MKFDINEFCFADYEKVHAPQSATESASTDLWLVDEILSEKVINGKRKFLLKWNGFDILE